MMNYITYYLKWSVLILINEQSTEEKYCNYLRNKYKDTKENVVTTQCDFSIS